MMIHFRIHSSYDDVVSDPYSSIFSQFAATHVLVSLLMAKPIHISGFTFAFIDDDSRVHNPQTLCDKITKYLFLPRDASAERGDATVSRLSVCLSVCLSVRP